ncbi:MAG TPA: peptide-binding protein [Virgibacillus sp.]|nr:peptide-binding protein [Virgibacillus sp.]
MKIKNRLFIVLTLLISLAFIVAACGGGDDLEDAMEDEKEGTEEEAEEEEEEEEEEEASGEMIEGGNVTLGIISDPVMFLPTHLNDTASGDIVDVMFSSLLQTDEEIDLQPDVAEDYEISDDGLTYTFYLRDGVTFHDGEPLTAEDVEFTYNIFIDEDYTGPRAGTFINLDEVVAVDEHTVEFHLSEVDARFITAMTYGILPKHILGDVPAEELEEHDFISNPIGSGPFKFDEWVDGQYVSLTAFDDYYEGRPHLDSLTLKIVGDQNALMAQIEAGDVDFGGVPADNYPTAEGWEEDGLVKLDSTLGFQYNYLGFNLRHDMFKDKETRQAIAHALDRQLIIDELAHGQGEVAHGPVSPLSWAYPDEMPEFEYDVEKAKELLAEAGWEEGADGILERDGERFEFTIKTNSGNTLREDLAVIVQSMLKEVGIEVKAEYIEWGAFLEQTEAPNFDFDMIILGWALGTDPDPRGIWHSSEIEQGLNNIGFDNEEVDKLIEESEKIVDQDERAEALHEIFEIIAEEQPYVFLYYPTRTVAMPTNLEGFTNHPRVPYYKTHEWHYVEE